MNLYTHPFFQKHMYTWEDVGAPVSISAYTSEAVLRILWKKQAPPAAPVISGRQA
jgi:hypothetical protein